MPFIFQESQYKEVTTEQYNDILKLNDELVSHVNELEKKQFFSCLNKGADINCRVNNDYPTIVGYVITRENIEENFVLELIKHRNFDSTHANYIVACECFLIQKAIAKGFIDVFRELVRLGNCEERYINNFDVNRKTALMYALDLKDTEIKKEVILTLLSNGANYNLLHTNGKSLIDNILEIVNIQRDIFKVAMARSDFNLFHELMAVNPDCVNWVDGFNRTALWHFAYENNQEAVIELIRRGANLNAQDINSVTVMSLMMCMDKVTTKFKLEAFKAALESDNLANVLLLVKWYEVSDNPYSRNVLFSELIAHIRTNPGSAVEQSTFYKDLVHGTTAQRAARQSAPVALPLAFIGDGFVADVQLPLVNSDAQVVGEQIELGAEESLASPVKSDIATAAGTHDTGSSPVPGVPIGRSRTLSGSHATAQSARGHSSNSGAAQEAGLADSGDDSVPTGVPPDFHQLLSRQQNNVLVPELRLASQAAQPTGVGLPALAAGTQQAARPHPDLQKRDREDNSEQLGTNGFVTGDGHPSFKRTNRNN